MNDLVVVMAAFVAGTLDAIVGGGGLILVPALFSVFPQAPAATLLGTNKSASVFGTAAAALQYSRRVTLDWAMLGPATLAALVGSLIGAWTSTLMDSSHLRKLLPFVLIFLLLYTVAKKDLGSIHAPLGKGKKSVMLGSGVGLVMGWYDGFFGPGTGSLLVFLLVRLWGYDFLHASAASKVLNSATNLAALVLFASIGHVWWQIGLTMAVANVLGSLLGTRLALRGGVAFVRQVFIAIVSALILKTGYDGFMR